MPTGREMASAMATETNERYMCPWIAGTMSSQKFSEIHSQSISLGSSSEKSCKSARPPERWPELSTRVAASRAGKSLNGLDGEQPFGPVLLYHGLGPS